MSKDKKFEEGTIWADASKYLKSIGSTGEGMSGFDWDCIPITKFDLYVFSKGEWEFKHKAEIDDEKKDNND